MHQMIELHADPINFAMHTGCFETTANILLAATSCFVLFFLPITECSQFKHNW